MPVIRDFAITEYGTATTGSLVCEMPIHEADDILLYFASKDGNPVIVDPAGIWTSLQDGATAGCAYRCGWALATGSTHTLTLTTGTPENFTVVVISIKGGVTGSPIATSAETGADDTAMPFDGPAGATTGAETNCLILHAWFSDSGLSPTAYAPLVNIYAGDNGSNSVGLAYTYQKAAGAITAAQWFGRGNDDGRGVVVALKDGSSEAEVPPYSDPAISSGQVLRPLVGLSTTFGDSWPVALTILALGEDFAANSVYVYESAPSWADDTTDANDPGTADVTWPMHNTGDAMYFGNSTPFGSLSFITSTAGVTGVLAWEYWNGAWTAAPGMSGSLTATGGAKVAFTGERPPTGWVTSDPGMGYTKYWVRARITTTYTTGITQSQIRLNGYVAAYIVATASADSGTNPYTDSTQDAGASSQANLSGCQMTFGAALDMDTGIIVGTLTGVLPSDFAKDIGLPAKTPGGVQITFFDTNNNCLSYKLGAKGCKSLSVDNRNVFAIDWNGSATAWAICGTISKSAVTYMYRTTLGYFAAAAHRWSMLSLVTRIGIAGGSSGYPLDLEDVAYAANNCIGMFPFVRLTGSAALIYAPLQFGGGDPTRIFCNLNTFQFPHVYDGVDYFDWNAAINVAGIKFYPKTGDVLKFTNCVFTSPSAYRWEFDASSASSGWTGDFSGTSVVNATVTLRDVFTFNLMSFIDCPAFTQNSAPITNSKFINTKVSVAAPADAQDIDDCTFTSSGTGHAMEIGGTAASINLDGLTFTGYAASDGSTGNEAIYVNIATGSMTISIVGGGSTPSIRTAGCTVTVVNAVNLTITGLVTGSDIVVYTAGTETVLDSVQNNAGTTWVYDYPAGDAGDDIDVGVFLAGYRPFYIRAYELGATDASIPAAQQVDRDYLA
jgi:hypothetical protein